MPPFQRRLTSSLVSECGSDGRSGALLFLNDREKMDVSSPSGNVRSCKQDQCSPTCRCVSVDGSCHPSAGCGVESSTVSERRAGGR